MFESALAIHCSFRTVLNNFSTQTISLFNTANHFSTEKLAISFSILERIERIKNQIGLSNLSIQYKHIQIAEMSPMRTSFGKIELNTRQPKC